MKFKISVRKNCIFAVSLMSVPSALVAGSGARPVLHHDVDAVPSPSVTDFIFAFGSLEPVTVGSGKVCSELRALSHRVA